MLPFVIGCALVTALSMVLDIDYASLLDIFLGIDQIHFLAIGICTILFVALSSLKWWLAMKVIDQGSHENHHWSLYAFYTALGAVLSTVIINHLSMIISRGVGAKLHLKRSPTIAMSASLYEQLFDMLVLLIFALSAAVVLAFNLDAWIWVPLAAFLIVTAVTALAFVPRPAARALLPPLTLLMRRNTRLKEIVQRLHASDARGLLEPKFMIVMLVISVARYGVLMLRAFLVVWGVEIPVRTVDFMNVFSLVQITGLVSLTPGGLGISEWSWAGVFLLWGYDSVMAVHFVLINRAMNMISVTAAFFLAFIIVLVTNGGQRRNDVRLDAEAEVTGRAKS